MNAPGEDQAIRPRRPGGRQHRPPRALQLLHRRPAPGDAVLRRRPRRHARPVPLPGLENIWLNFGRTQVHMPSRAVPPKAEVLARHGRLRRAEPRGPGEAPGARRQGDEAGRAATGEKFSYTVKKDCIEATCPWGNRVRCHAPAPEFGQIELGLAYVDFDVRRDTAEGIARFYSEVMQRAGAGLPKKGAPRWQHRPQPAASTSPRPKSPLAGVRQPPHPGLHRRLRHARTTGSRSATSSPWRPTPTSGASSGSWTRRTASKLFQIEHEVRSMKHRLFNRPLVNRNHAHHQHDLRVRAGRFPRPVLDQAPAPLPGR